MLPIILHQSHLPTLPLNCKFTNEFMETTCRPYKFNIKFTYLLMGERWVEK
jgi:hypothetical protein